MNMGTSGAQGRGGDHAGTQQLDAALMQPVDPEAARQPACSTAHAVAATTADAFAVATEDAMPDLDAWLAQVPADDTMALDTTSTFFDTWFDEAPQPSAAAPAPGPTSGSHAVASQPSSAAPTGPQAGGQHMSPDAAGQAAQLAAAPAEEVCAAAQPTPEDARQRSDQPEAGSRLLAHADCAGGATANEESHPAPQVKLLILLCQRAMQPCMFSKLMAGFAYRH